MDAILQKLASRGRKPMLRRKGLTTSPALKAPAMTLMIGLGKPSGAEAKRDVDGYPTDHDDTPVKETSPEGLSAKLDALMERMDEMEAHMQTMMGDDEEKDGEEDTEDEDEEAY